MKRRSFFALFTAFLAVPFLKRRDDTHTITAAEMPNHNHDPIVPSGTVLAFAGTQPPPGWVLCDGSHIHSVHLIQDPGHSHTLQPNYIRKV
jgi:microcystin-dependent protein